MKNILFITSSISFGGAAKMLCFVAESLAIRGFNITIANLRITQNVTDFERSLKNGVTVVSVPKSFGNIHVISYIIGLGKKINADIVIGFTAFPNIYAVIVGKILHIPSIISERGDPYRTFDNSLKSRFMKYIINQATGGVFQTEGALKFYCKHLQNKGIVIPNPIFHVGEIPHVKYEEREKSIVSVGRLDNFQKRIDVMLNAFKIFSKRHPDYTLKLYGRGMNENEIKQWCIDLGIADKVKFMGLSLHPMQDIAKDGMFLITSDFEGISNSLLEAMAVGLPCVSTDHTPGGARLLIQDYENGLLVPIGDSEGLAEAMCKFADNPLLAKKCGNNAMNVINRFAPSRIIDMWENYISSLLQ